MVVAGKHSALTESILRFYQHLLLILCYQEYLLALVLAMVLSKTWKCVGDKILVFEIWLFPYLKKIFSRTFDRHSNMLISLRFLNYFGNCVSRSNLILTDKLIRCVRKCIRCEEHSFNTSILILSNSLCLAFDRITHFRYIFFLTN